MEVSATTVKSTHLANGANQQRQQQQIVQPNNDSNCNNLYNKLHSVPTTQQIDNATILADHKGQNSPIKSITNFARGSKEMDQEMDIARVMRELIDAIEGQSLTCQFSAEGTTIVDLPLTDRLINFENQTSELQTLSPEECALVIDNDTPPQQKSPPEPIEAEIGQHHNIINTQETDRILSNDCKLMTTVSLHPPRDQRTMSMASTITNTATNMTANAITTIDIATDDQKASQSVKKDVGGMVKHADDITNEMMQSNTNERSPDKQDANKLDAPATVLDQSGTKTELIAEPGSTKIEKLVEDRTKININITGDIEMRDEQEPELKSTNIEEDEEEKNKDIVTLRNLEISPPPMSSSNISETDSKPDASKAGDRTSRGRCNKKRPRSTDIMSESGTDANDSVDSGGRSKRQRTQTKLFQAGDVPPLETITSKPKTPKPSSRSRKRSTLSSTPNAETSSAHNIVIQHAHDQQDVIFYEKNDYLAIRNEENSFYLCQLAENVRVMRPMIKIKWLDTNDDGKTYFLTSHFDKVPQKSIIMPVILNKLKSEKKGEQVFMLEDQDKDNIMERLKRSLNVPTEGSVSQE